jgi:hypothetical protein
MFSSEKLKVLEGETSLLWQFQQKFARIKKEGQCSAEEFLDLRDELEVIALRSENPAVVKRAEDLLSEMDSFRLRRERYA